MERDQSISQAHLLELIGNGLGLFVPLKPHHVLGVEPPGLLLQGFGCQILGLSALQRGEETEGKRRLENRRKDRT